MNKMTHRKRRNTGLLYEFLVSYVSKKLVEGDQKTSNAALRILKKFFKPGTELYREFRLVHSLMKTTVSSDAVAANIVSEARTEAQKYDVSSLEREKSLLIREINHKLNDSLFFDQPIVEYRTYATVQTLIDSWRSKRYDISERATYEDRLVQHLLSEKAQGTDEQVEMSSPGSGRLLMKIMLEKLNTKYNDSLTGDQKAVIREYVWSTTNDDSQRIVDKLSTVRNDLIVSIDGYVSSVGEDQEYTLKQLAKVKESLVNESFQTVDDETIARVMLYMKLHDELVSEEA